MVRQIDFQDDGGTPAWRRRAAERLIDARTIDVRRRRRDFGRLMAGPRWERWSPARRLAWWFFLPVNFAGGVIVGAIVGIVVAELLGVIH